ncbi:FKBP-type peptidyl-prolyl cis-trans isomerase N-terminal domain-containing protein [Coxiella endosymbiont of Ornithodoros amblus]|uniref:FKBP-type peptidyl-prolyl cis-trans isomerase N-terminal domain-containing protein n=1 Tax=Coxiella endosymbiont of Ornithodoros amblus TaxID=1656166 RepID=UPI003CC79965
MWACFWDDGARGYSLKKTEQDKLSYSMGVITGKAFKKNDIKIDPQTFSIGLSNAYLGKETQMTEAEMRQTLYQFQKQYMQKMQQKMKQTAQQNAEKSSAFLAANKNKLGVKTLLNGLQYKVLQAGQGQIPTLNDEVTIIYKY